YRILWGLFRKGGFVRGWAFRGCGRRTKCHDLPKNEHGDRNQQQAVEIVRNHVFLEYAPLRSDSGEISPWKVVKLA
ncbi:hypothetical protein EBZ37_06135, partial [bacterium]|nr:hypothetical protein [bacterium]